MMIFTFYFKKSESCLKQHEKLKIQSLKSWNVWLVVIVDGARSIFFYQSEIQINKKHNVGSFYSLAFF